MNQTKLNLVVFRSISITFSFYFLLLILTERDAKAIFLRTMELLKHRKLKRLLKRMFPNRIIKVTDNPDKSQTISIL